MYPFKYLSDTNRIVSYLSYDLISCGNECKSLVEQILVLQERALRLIYFAETNDNAMPFLLARKVYLYTSSVYCESAQLLCYV